MPEETAAGRGPERSPPREATAAGERDAVADGYNAGYAEQLAERTLRERGLVPPSLAEWAGNGAGPAPAAVSGRAPAREPAAPEAVPAPRVVAAAAGLLEAHREHGHLAVGLDPLGSPPPGHPALDPEWWGTSREELATVPASALGLERLGDDMAAVLDRLREAYCGGIGYELAHVDDPERRRWLEEVAEERRYRRTLTDEEARALHRRLAEVEGLERFLHRSYLGKKRFSAEGLDIMVPMLDEALRLAADAGTREVFLGMAHRGRLNVLAHVVGRGYESVVAEFEGEQELGLQVGLPEGGAGDVKYHVGSRGTVRVGEEEVSLRLAPNPSHLEHVNPVVEGMARAARDRSAGEPGRVLPVLIHGDAAFIGQGVVAETLNLCRLEGYETHGTFHLIANNQLGFTTGPPEGRSTRYPSDLALGFRIPVLHVNADDPESCLEAVRTAIAYRFAFGEDIVLDLVGYRRYGHNEGDEPGYTQPGMYRQIEEHPSVRALWAEELAGRGVLSTEEAEAVQDEVADRLAAAREAVLEGEERPRDLAGSEVGDGEARLTAAEEPAGTDTGVPVERLRALNEGLHAWPEDFELFRKLGSQMERRREAAEDALDWAHAEALAFASLVTDGVPVRLTGEDTERGTFSQRHLVLHDVSGEGTWVPLQHLAEGQAPFEVWNSPLSEVATLGFEYGFSTVALDALVLWEAQFGDFVNVGQAIIDQFIVSGRSKWGQESRLVLLLPHGYEGQGPEHSSARLERFLQLAADGEIRVANPTTPAQYFHLLRLQALRPDRRPLVVMTPKSLLRHPRARSSLEELAGGAFRPVLPDPERTGEDGTGEDGDVRRVLLCSGKIYYDLVGSEHREEATDAAVLRVEGLHPFPFAELEEALGRYPGMREIRWVQEEPSNMGAWRYAEPFLRTLAGPERPLKYVGRPAMASPAEGYGSHHGARQARIVADAFAEVGEEEPPS